MTLTQIYYVLSIFILCYLRGLLASRRDPLVFPCDNYDNDSDTPLRMLEEVTFCPENDLCFLLWIIISALILPKEHVLILLCVFLSFGAVSDLQTNMVSDMVSIPIVLLGLTSAARWRGMAIALVIYALLLAFFKWGDRIDSFFGGADALIVLGLAGYFDAFYFMLCLASACFFGIGLKLIRWITHADKREETGIPFIPGLFLSSILTGILSELNGPLIQNFSFEDILYLTQYFLSKGEL